MISEKDIGKKFICIFDELKDYILSIGEIFVLQEIFRLSETIYSDEYAVLYFIDSPDNSNKQTLNGLGTEYIRILMSEVDRYFISPAEFRETRIDKILND
jgi:hypothetical protein